MGKRGPKRTPTSILELRGSPLAKDRPADPAPVPCKTIKPPSYLNREAKKAFRLQEEQLRRDGLLKPSMRELLATWALCWTDYRRAQQAVEELISETYQLANKAICPRPELAIRDAAFKKLVAISDKLRLFPDPIQPVKKAAETKAEPTGRDKFFSAKFGNNRV